MSKNMVERVGDAIAAAWDSGTAIASGLPPIEFTSDEKALLARAAIEAMAEPTYGQLHEALNDSRMSSPETLPACKEIWAAEKVWRSMITAALKP